MNNKTNLIPASSGSNPIISESSSLSYLEGDALEAVITLPAGAAGDAVEQKDIRMDPAPFLQMVQGIQRKDVAASALSRGSLH